MLADGVVAASEQSRFLGAVDSLGRLRCGELYRLTFVVDPQSLGKSRGPGIFDWNDHARLRRMHADAEA
jgi:2-methylcitrate dehydratase